MFVLVWLGLVLNGMVHGYCLYVVPCKNSSSWFEKQQSYGYLVWFGIVRSGLVLNGMVHEYCPGVVPCKNLSSWL